MSKIKTVHVTKQLNPDVAASDLSLFWQQNPTIGKDDIISIIIDAAFVEGQGIHHNVFVTYSDHRL
jgi:hypothetical protein